MTLTCGGWRALAVLAGLVCGGPALAAPPHFNTDDAATVENWEINLGATLTKVKGRQNGAAPSADINYGVTDNFQLHALAALGHDRPAGTHRRWGTGDSELGFKHRFLDGDPDGWLPAIAFAPMLRIPTGDEERGLGTGRTRLVLPLWMSKEFGEWQAFGGAAFNTNPGPGNHNFWLFGGGVEKGVTEALTFGLELFHTTPDAIDGRHATTLNVGAVYEIFEGHNLLMSVSRSLQNTDRTNQLTTYLGYQLLF
jgi:hypothetical protein